VGAESHAQLGPGREVVRGGDGAAAALALADAPELGKGGGALDGGGVDALGRVNVVGCAVAGDLALVGGAGRRVVRAVRLNDVVLDQRRGGPAVDGEVRVAAGVVGSREGNGTGPR
jgi:hypothetical protein